MPRRSRRLAAARENRRNVRFPDFCRMLEDAGFLIRSGKGSHYIAEHPANDMTLTFPRRDPLRIGYVIRALKMID